MYDTAIAGVFSGRPNHDLYLYVRVESIDVPNNRSLYAWELQARRRSGAVSFNNASMPWAVDIGGGVTYGNSPLNFSGGVSVLSLGTGISGWMNHDSEGYASFGIAASFDASASQFGGASASGTFFADRIAKVPAATPAPTVSAIQPTSAKLAWSPSPDSRGASVDQYLLRVNKNNPADSAGYVDYAFDAATFSFNVTGLTPGTNYYSVVYAHNAMGYSVKSAQATFKTLSGAYVWSGVEWRPTEVLVWNGTAWVPGEVQVRKTSAWAGAG